MTRPAIVLGLALVIGASTGFVSAAPNQDVLPEAPGLGDPGKLVSLEIVSLNHEDRCHLTGRDARAQLIVVGHYVSGQQRDLSRDVTYTSHPEGIVQVDSTGFVVPLSEGETTIHVDADEQLQATLDVEVTHLIEDVPVNFPNEVVPVFTKYGCNGGGCHGKSGGQNGFRPLLVGVRAKRRL